MNWGFLLGGLPELGTVKTHLMGASREVLWALHGLLGFADQYVSSLSLSKGRQQSLSGVIDTAQRTLRIVAERLPRGSQEEYRLVHRKVMNSILEVLEREVRKNVRSTHQKARMKVEVLQAIRNVLLQEIHERETGGNGGHDHTA